MSYLDPEARESPFKLQCQESTLCKMRAMAQLSEVMGGDGVIKLASLIPIANIINAIVNKDRPAYSVAVDGLKSFITDRRKDLQLQNIPVIAEINFLEGFDSFVSYIHTGNIDEEEEDMVEVDDETSNTQSLNSHENSPVAGKTNRKRRIPKSLEESREVVFRCSRCKRTFPSEKAAKDHIGDWLSRCPSAKIIADGGEKKPREDVDEDEGVTSLTAMSVHRRGARIRQSEGESIGKGRKSTGQVMECPAEGCAYSNDDWNCIYVHVKSKHSECTTIFKCLKCGDTKKSGAAMKNHVQLDCPDAKASVELVKRDPDQTEGQTEILQWEVALHKCPIQSCEFIASEARQLHPHFNKAHSESTLTFRCSNCPNTKTGLRAVIAHCKSCDKGCEPEVVVNGKVMVMGGKKTARVKTPEVQRRSLVTFAPVPAPSTPVKRGRGRPPKTPKKISTPKKGDEKEKEEEVVNAAAADVSYIPLVDDSIVVEEGIGIGDGYDGEEEEREGMDVFELD